MKYSIIFCFLCGLQLALLSIMMEPGFVEVNKEWENYTGKPLEEVKESLSGILPNVMFAVFKLDQVSHYSSEFYYNKIKITVNSSNHVVSNPTYLGSEPNLEFDEDLVGKSYQDAIAIMRTRLTQVKIVVKRDDTIISVDPRDTENENFNYINVKIDNDSKVVEKPKYVRV